ncbi:hypothetical protein HPB50_008047 [Hyalomma asiaticum]|uniref:Uncharacterized protein n=1 Tax=Hyalomma asiaticum TaxID=266040 RepID=A0ACB7SWE2_HYAAI|nr:hypothetical protein HPB50_008047 [Hyalomma asiaticum]
MMSDTCHQAGRARCGSKKKKRPKNCPVITDSKRPTPVQTTEPTSKMTVSQAPELKKKKRRSRKRKLLPGTDIQETSGLCVDIKKPKLSSDSAAELADTRTLSGTRNHNFVSYSAPVTNSDDTPSTVTGHCADTNVACVNSTANPSSPLEDSEEVERRRIKAHLHKQRRALPIFPVRKELVRVVRQRDCVILIGETACGKTTQLPQYLHATGFTKRGIVGITQPRRVAAVTVADRVAMEMGVELGDLVGYSVRFDDTTSNATRIKYLTDGMLLREALLDPLLRRYAVVVLDEAHERTVNTDILFGVVKTAQKERQRLCMVPLKIVVMSATMDVDHFSRYFNNAPVYTLEGRQHPIEMMYAVKPQEDYIFSALVTVFQIHRNQGPGTYQPGTGLEVLKVRKISKAQAWQRAGRAGRECSGICYRLFTKVQYEAMREHSIPEIQRCSLSGVVLQMLALGIEDVFAFDFMDKPSDKDYEAVDENVSTCCEETLEELITEVQADDQPSSSDEDDEGGDIASAVVPSDSAAKEAVELLQRYFEHEGCPEFLASLSGMGAYFLKKHAKQTTLHSFFSPTQPDEDEVLTIISILSGDSVLYFNEKQRERAAEVWKKFQSNEGDHVMLLNVYKAYKSVKGNKAWCKENFVNKKNMMKAIEIRSQLADLCAKAGLPSRSCGQDSSALRKCLASGLFANVAELQKNGDYITLDARKKVHIHPSSCLFSSSPACVVFTEMVETTKCYMRNLTVVDPDWLPDVAPHYFKKKRLGAKTLS